MIDDVALQLTTLKSLTYPITNIEFWIDETTDFYKLVSVEGRKLSVKNGCNHCFPVLLAKSPIQNRQFFEVEITKAANKCVALGVTLFEHRNKTNIYYL
jgi:hypothetical protein